MKKTFYLVLNLNAWFGDPAGSFRYWTAQNNSIVTNGDFIYTLHYTLHTEEMLRYYTIKGDEIFGIDGAETSESILLKVNDYHRSFFKLLSL